ncbi:MAG: T9SS type A sorting domain-containing protein [Bacteroidota bacterium]
MTKPHENPSRHLMIFSIQKTLLPILLVFLSLDLPGKNILFETDAPVTCHSANITNSANIRVAWVNNRNLYIENGDATPSFLDGTDFLSACSRTHTFEIRNFGVFIENLELTGSPIVAISGSSDFSVTRQPAITSINSVQRVPFAITFTPSSTGLKTATVIIESNDPDDNPYTFDIQGELFTGTNIYVNDDASGNNDGTSWDDAFTDLQNALWIAGQCDIEIWVAEGTYLPTIRNQFRMPKNAQVLGGFPNTGNPGLADRDWDTFKTTLSGDRNGDDGPGFTNMDDNFATFIWTTDAGVGFLLEGFFIESAKGTEGAWYNLSETPPTISHCTFQNNLGTFSSSIYTFTSGNKHNAAIVKNCRFINNQSTFGGAGQFHTREQATLDWTFVNCEFRNNKAAIGNDLNILGFDDSESTVSLVNCTFQNDGQPYLDNGSPRNIDDAISLLDKVDLTVKNSIFWRGTGLGQTINFGGAATVHFENTLLEEGGCPAGTTCGSGMFYNVDPLFRDAANGDVSLADCSPAVDAGLDAHNSETTDLANLPRQSETIPGGEKIDLGAFEYQGIFPISPVCQNRTVELDEDGQASIMAADIDNGSTVACGDVSLDIDLASFDCSHIGTTPVSLIVTDGVNNSQTCTAIVTVEDNLAPVASCSAQAVLADFDTEGNYSLDPNDFDDNSMDNCTNVTIAASPTSFTCQNEGPNTITLTVADSYGNTSTCEGKLDLAPFLEIENIEPTTESCEGAGDGTILIEAVAVGGQIGYSIDGGVNFSFGNEFNSLTPGTYTIVVKVFGIANICEKTDVVTVGTGPSPTVWYKDLDNDGYTDGITMTSCSQPTGFVAVAMPNDCNDNNPLEHPNQTWYEDLDADGYGSGNMFSSCQRPTGGYVPSELTSTSGDCNDNDPLISPGSTEVCNGVDDNCDAEIDEGLSGETFAGNVFITNQQQLNDFPSCYSTIFGSLTISGGDITDLTNLQNLSEVTGSVTIFFNSSLNSLAGLESLASIGGGFNFYYNFALTDCCAIYDLLNSGNGIAGPVIIFFNTVGCNSQSEILNNCTTSSNLIAPAANASTTSAEPHGEIIFSLFPNPVSEELTVSFSGKSKAGRIALLNLHGQLLKQQILQESQQSSTIAVDHLSSGLYILQLSLDGSTISKKIMVR